MMTATRISRFEQLTQACANSGLCVTACECGAVIALSNEDIDHDIGGLAISVAGKKTEHGFAMKCPVCSQMFAFSWVVDYERDINDSRQRANTHLDRLIENPESRMSLFWSEWLADEYELLTTLETSRQVLLKLLQQGQIRLMTGSFDALCFPSCESD